MSPILTGVIASGISGHLTPPWSPEGGYDSLAAVTLSTTTASVTFSDIPSGYKHLQVRTINRDTRTGTNEQSVMMRFNADTGSNYSRHYLEGYGSGTPSVGSTTSTDWIKVGLSPTSSTNANIYGAFVVDILDYSTSKYKTARSFGGDDLNGSGTIGLWSGLWMNTNAITSITLLPTNGESWVTNSNFALYGVK